MKSTSTWAVALAVLLAALLQQPAAWGQLRTKSGAAKGSFEHPKALEQRVFQYTNEARRKHGLVPLEPDKTLVTLARKKSDDMIKRHYFSHTDPDGKNIRDLYAAAGPAAGEKMAGLGENICMGGRNDYDDTETEARSIVDGFMVSPGHRKNILEPAYTHLGIGISTQGKERFVTQSFGRIFNKQP